MKSLESSSLDLRLEPITMKDRVVEVIRTAMLRGELQPGERIVELQLAKRLGLGTTSIREALFELEKQGFVERVAHKGAYVVELSREDVRQIYAVRMETEGLAVELFTPLATAAHVASIQEILDNMARYAATLDRITFYHYDLEFHRFLWNLSGNRYLARILEGIVPPLFAFCVLRSRRDANNLLEATAKHQAILDAIVGRDPKKARRVMEDVLREYRDDEVASFSGRSAFEPAS